MKRYKQKVGLAGELRAFAKYPLAAGMRLCDVLRNLPVPTDKKLILFEAYAGRRIDCNPRAIYEYLREQYPGKFKYVWAVNDLSKWEHIAARSDTSLVKYRSLEHRKYACEAGTLVVNLTRSGDLPSRRDQLQIQTWHGEGYKVVAAAVHNTGAFQRWLLAHKARRYNYVISSNEFFTRELIRKQLLFQGDVLKIGTPRNDRLVSPSEDDRKRQRELIGLEKDDFFVLFVPTWRDFGDEIASFNVEHVRAAFQKRFGGHIIMGQRGHYFSDFTDSSFDLDLGDYEDMQGLLLACDAIISDYSSVIWDFSFTYRPCFLFAPDHEQYEHNRGFNEPIETWGFPVSETEDRLISDIMNFDANLHRANMERHHALRGSFETGTASKAVAEIILQHAECD